MRFLSHAVLVFILLFASPTVGPAAQTATDPGHTVSGVVRANGEPVAFAAVSLSGDTVTGHQASTDTSGRFRFRGVHDGAWTLTVIADGFERVEETVTVHHQDIEVEVALRPDVLRMDEVVVTGTRRRVPIQDAPVIVSRIGTETLEETQSLTLSEGLTFSPGLRVETNCQNCGFTQLRMNGLDGAYSQVLINGRPVYSALTGVYGLEMIPTRMIDRVEVVKGGGSALYGGNAIAGTVNIITRRPTMNAFEVGLHQGFTDLEIPDRVLSMNGSIVAADGSKGLSVDATHRMRNEWDANGDLFSELTRLRSTTIGANAFVDLGARTRLDIHVNAIDEFRRGGNRFDLAPHQTDVTEQLDHRILGGGLDLDQTFRDDRHRLSVYASAQWTDRSSYYGGGGRVLRPGDSLTVADITAINAYGSSRDISAVAGAQHDWAIRDHVHLLIGAEHILSDVVDAMPGYDRTIDQQVHTTGGFTQVDITLWQRLQVLAGLRLDHVRIDGRSDLGVETLQTRRRLTVAVPRLSLKLDLTDELTARTSFAQGYRAPQAFDEDLHIETVGGAARFVRLGPDLRTERSNSVTASLAYTRLWGRAQLSMVAEGFFTHLSDPFLLSDPVERPSGVAVITKRNGSAARVQGVNLEVNAAWTDRFTARLGATAQTARYDDPEVLWQPDDPGDERGETSTRRLVRTPNLYGFATLTARPVNDLDVTLGTVVTGPMDVPHVIDPGDEYTVLERSPTFVELNARIAYDVPIASQMTLRVFAGMQNIANAYQRDLDVGADRDAGYVYGPSRPRTLFFGVRVGWNQDDG